jgi:hypothetical protein
VKRPIGVTMIAILTFFGATILALGSCAFFVVAFIAMTGVDAAEPISVAIIGMAIAGGFSLLVLSGVAVCLAIGVLDLREWARIVSIASISTGIGCAILSLLGFKGYLIFPVVPSIVCHLLVMVTAIWMLAYLLLPRVKHAFSALTA